MPVSSHTAPIAVTVTRPLTDHADALACANRIIDAQAKIMVAYRTNGRTPSGAIDTLTAERPRLTEYNGRSEQ